MSNFEKPSATDQQNSIDARNISAAAWSSRLAQAQAYANQHQAPGSIGSAYSYGNQPEGQPQIAQQLVGSYSTPASQFDTAQLSPGLQSALSSVYGNQLDSQTADQYGRPLTVNLANQATSDGGLGVIGRENPDSTVTSYARAALDQVGIGLPDDRGAVVKAGLQDPAVQKMSDRISNLSSGLVGKPDAYGDIAKGPFSVNSMLDRVDAAPNSFSSDAGQALTITKAPTTLSSLYASAKPSQNDGIGTKVGTSAVNAALGIVPGVGMINGLSSMLGGPNLGSLLAHNSTPGAPAQAVGNANDAAASRLAAALQTAASAPNSTSGGSIPAGALSSLQAAIATGDPAKIAAAVAAFRASVLNGGSTPASSTPTLTDAQLAYNTALANLPGPQDQSVPSTASPLYAPTNLVAPTVTGGGWYNPLG